MSKYIGISAGYQLAEWLKESIFSDGEDGMIKVIWQDLEYLVLEMDETCQVPAVLASLDTPYIELSEEELKNSPAEILEYLDAVRWMRLPEKQHLSVSEGLPLGHTHLLDKKHLLDKQHLSEKQQVLENSAYTAMITGEIGGIREFLLKGRKGSAASKEAMKRLEEVVGKIWESVREFVEAAGGKAYVAGGMAEVFLPVTNEDHQIFAVCEKMKKSFECEELAELLEQEIHFQQNICLFPSELPAPQKKREAKDGIISLCVDRRMGDAMEFEIQEDRIPNLDKRVLFTCRSIGHGADYIQLLSKSVYNESLLMYGRFLNRECQPVDRR